MLYILSDDSYSAKANTDFHIYNDRLFRNLLLKKNDTDIMSLGLNMAQFYIDPKESKRNKQLNNLYKDGFFNLT